MNILQKNKERRKGILLVALSVILLSSACTSYESLLNFNGAPGMPSEPIAISNYVPPIIRPNDILSIRIASNDAASVQPFIITSGAETDQNQGAGTNYLVNENGEIEMPTLRYVKLEGLTTTEAKDKLLGLLSGYFADPPLIQVSLTNFNVTINGEVASPQIILVSNERITALEAITLAGDFTVNSRRDSILVMREINGMRNFGYLDFHSTDVFSSPYFYLQKNDVIYVRPAKTKLNTIASPASRVLPWVSTAISLSLFVFSVIRFSR